MKGLPSHAACETTSEPIVSALDIANAPASVAGAVTPDNAIDMPTTGIPDFENSIAASADPLSIVNGLIGHCTAENIGLRLSSSSPPTAADAIAISAFASCSPEA